MRFRFLFVFLTLLLPMGFTFSVPAWAATAADEQRELAQIRAFKLTDRFVDQYLAAAADPAYPGAALDGATVKRYLVDKDEPSSLSHQSFDQFVREVEAKPGVQNFLSRYHLTVREFLTGRVALAFAAVEQISREHPEWVDDGKDDNDDDEEDAPPRPGKNARSKPADRSELVSPNNMTVFLRNKDKLEKKMFEVGRRRLSESQKGVAQKR